MDQGKGVKDSNRRQEGVCDDKNGLLSQALGWLNPLKGNSGEIPKKSTNVGESDKSLVGKSKTQMPDGDAQMNKDAAKGGWVMPKGYFCK